MIGCYYPYKVRSGYKFKFLFIKIPSYTLIPCLHCDWCKNNFKHPDDGKTYNEVIKEHFK